MSLCIGLDIGATRTKAVLVSTEEGVVRAAESGPGNPATTDIEVVRKNLKSAVDAIIKDVSGTLECVGIGSAAAIGEARDILLTFYSGFFSDYGLKPERVFLFEDTVSAHISAFLFDDGVVFIAGTGSNCYGTYKGKSVRIGGWGYLLGDEGSGFWIAQHGLIAALRAYDGRGKKTALLEKMLEFYKVDNPEKVIITVYATGVPVSVISRFAPVVFEVAKAGDEVALSIVKEAVSEMALAIETAIKRLGAEKLRIAVTGGVWDSEKEFLEPMLKEELEKRLGWRPEIESAKIRPECASALYALKETGLLTDDVVKKVVETCRP